MIDGGGIRIDGPELPEPEIVERDGFLFVKGGEPITVDEVARLRTELADSKY